MTSSEEDEEDSISPGNYRESKIFFDGVPNKKPPEPLPRHPTPTPKQLKELKAKRMSWEQQNKASAVPARPAPKPPKVISNFS